MLSKRLHALDELRGFAMVAVLVYHLLVSLWMFGYVADPRLSWTQLIGLTGGVMFLMLAGFSQRLSHAPVRRSLITAGAALLVWAATALTGLVAPITFGVLHCIAVCGLMAAALRAPLERVPPLLGMSAALILFVLTYGVPEGRILDLALPQGLYRARWLFWLGLPHDSYAAADFYPLLPWIFAYLAGYFIFGLLQKRGGLERLSVSRLKPLAFIGRHTLIIYLVHQPVYLAVLYGIYFLRTA